jgi:peptide chain release factor subunit 3
MGAVKERLNIVIIGHVDADKSRMGGYPRGTIDKRTMEKYVHEAKEAGCETW